MHSAKLLKLFVLVTVLILTTVGVAQQIRFEDFFKTDGLILNGPQKATWNSIPVLRLTQGPNDRRSIDNGGSTAWFNVPQPTTSGFTSYFRFIFHNPLQCCAPGDGLAFVIQGSSYTDSSYGATGGGRTAVGVGNGGLGYAGIPNSVAIEFDTAQEAWDPTGNHVAVQTCDNKTNGPVHLPGVYTIGNNNNVTSCLYTYQSQKAISSAIPPLGAACATNGCMDGIPVTVVVEYTPPKDQTSDGRLQVYVDPLLIPGTHTPVLTATAQIDIPFTIQKHITYNNAGGLALVGITSGYGADTQTTDLIAWEYTPHTPTQIQQMIQDHGNPTNFYFGNHFYQVTYPMDFSNNQGILMTVNAIPIGQTDFYNARLKNNTLFDNEQCITYLSTGGNCIVYEVTCQDPITHMNVDCPNPFDMNHNEEPIATLTTYATTDPVNAGNADYIKAPIGTNNWCSIFTEFIGGNDDPTNVGSGNNFSDFVATFKTGPGQDPQCPPPGSARNMLRKLPQTNASAPATNSQAEPGPAGANK